jgi:mannose-1-phosphate guanylyltransferase
MAQDHMSTVYAVIMAGGRGERFWPLSTEEKPKPFVSLVGSTTLLQGTVERLRSLVPAERILIAIGSKHREIASRQVPEIPPGNFILEPVGRDTAACLGLSALHLAKLDPEAIMLALPADHYVADPEKFCQTVRAGLESLAGATGIVFGIRPDRAETGYGYVRAEKPALRTAAWPVVRFVEKPDAATAAKYVRSGTYFWNSGMFLWSNRTLLGLFQRYMPGLSCALNEILPLLGRDDARDEMLSIFSSLPRISVDYGILEKASGLRLVPAGFDWDDIGNWDSLARAVPADPSGNVSRGSAVSVQSRNCVLYSEGGTVAVFGVSDLVVVRARGRVLVCSRERAADLKTLLSSLPEELK